MPARFRFRSLTPACRWSALVTAVAVGLLLARSQDRHARLTSRGHATTLAQAPLVSVGDVPLCRHFDCLETASAQAERQNAARAQVKYTFVSTTWPPLSRQGIPCKAGQPFDIPTLLRDHLPKFYGLPPRSHWEIVWAQIKQGLKHATCSTPVQASVRLPSPHHGFGSQMNNFVNEVLVSMYSGMPITLCSPPGVRDMWAENFVNPGLPYCNNAACNVPPPDVMDAPMVWCSGANASMYLAGKEPDSLISIKRFLFQKLFQLKPEVSDRVTSLQRQLGILNEPYVGIHFRRGDKIREAGFFRKAADFANYAVELCRAMGARKIFLASDDPDAASEFRHLIHNGIQIVSQLPQSPEEYAERGTLDPRTEEVLINDVVLLIRANALVGTASSNLDRFVWFQRDPSTQSVSLDDGGSYILRSC